MDHLNKSLFGEDFKWGVSTAAFQIEGALMPMVKANRFGMHLQQKKVKY